LKVSGVPHHPAKAGVGRVAPDFIRARQPRFGVDPPEQRLEADVIVRIGQEIDEPRHATARLLRVTVDGIAFRVPVPLQRRHGVSHVRRLDVLPVEIGRVAAHGEGEPIRQPFPQLGERGIEPADGLDIGVQRADARSDAHNRQRDRRNQTVDPHRPLRKSDRASCEGLHQTGNRRDVGPMQLLQERGRRIGEAESERRVHAAVPRAEELFVQAAALPLGGNHRVGPPRRGDFASAKREANRDRGVVADDRRPFANDPQQRRAVRIVRIATVLPVPSQSACRGRVGAEDASVKRFDAALVLRLVPIYLGHEWLGVV